MCCCMVPCTCGFDAFDGSGRKFLTRTTTATGTIITNGPPFCRDNVATMTFSSTKVERYNTETCEIECVSCEGTANCTVQFCNGTSCTTTLNAHCSGYVNPCSPTPSILFNASGCAWDNAAACPTAQCIGCTAFAGPTETPVSATETTFSWDWDSPPHTSYHATNDIVLSDECTPV